MDSIIHSIKKQISEIAGIDESQISDNDSFKNDLGVDDLDMIEIIMELEEEFNMEINDDVADGIREGTVEQLAQLIKKEVDSK